MLHRVSCLLAAFLLAGTSLAEDFSRFRIPEHSVFSLTGELEGVYDRTDVDTYDMEMKDAFWQSTFVSSGCWLVESDRCRSSLSFDGTVIGFRDSYERLSSSGAYRGLDTELHRELIQALDSDWDVRLYPWECPVGLTATLTATAGWAQGWWHRERDTEGGSQHSHEWEDIESWEYYYSAQTSFGIGIGRVRNATSVYDVVVLERRLREVGVITKPLRDATRQALIDLFYREGDYKILHQRPDRFFWRDVERILFDDPAVVSQDYDSYIAQRLEESFFPYRRSRSIGWFFGFHGAASHTHELDRWFDKEFRIWNIQDGNSILDTTSYGWNRYDWSEDEVALGVRAEYYRPLGTDWQISLSTTYDLPVQRPGDGYDWESSAEAFYLLADRWNARLGVFYTREIIDPKDRNLTHRDQWYVAVYPELGYFIEDNLELSLNLNLRHQKYDYHIPNCPDYAREDYYRDTRVALGMTYLFRGAILPRFNGYLPVGSCGPGG